MKLRHYSPAHVLLATSVLSWLQILNVCDARVFSRCEFVAEAKKHFPLDQIDKWTCIARYESNFDTDATNIDNEDNSTDHGIFQINDRYWCSPGPANMCNVSCEALRSDNLTAAVACAQTIVSIQGFSAWSVYPIYCNNSYRFSKDCTAAGFDVSLGRTSFTFAAPPSLFNPPFDRGSPPDRNVEPETDDDDDLPYVGSTYPPVDIEDPSIKRVPWAITTISIVSTSTKAPPSTPQKNQAPSPIESSGPINRTPFEFSRGSGILKATVPNTFPTTSSSAPNSHPNLATTSPAQANRIQKQNSVIS